MCADQSSALVGSGNVLAGWGLCKKPALSPIEQGVSNHASLSGKGSPIQSLDQVKKKKMHARCSILKLVGM